MNEKASGIAGAIIVGLIVAIGQVWIQKRSDRDDSTATNLAALNERVGALSKQLDKLTDQPYARREELAAVSGRVDGLEQRVVDVERAEFKRRDR